MAITRILFGVALLLTILNCGPAMASTTPVGIQAQEEMKAKGDESETPLMRAIRDTDLKVFQSLLDHADVNARDEQGGTALMLATRLGETPFVKALLKRGADVNAQAKDGTTALMMTSHMIVFESKADVEIAKVLIEHGADVNAKDKDGLTPLMYAAGSDRLKVVKLLLEKGAKINDEDAKHATALTYALRSQRQDMIEYLKSAGATGPEPEPVTQPAKVASVDQRPAPLNFPQPHYTEQARQNKVEGVVIARVLVGPDGKVQKVRITKGLPDGLTNQAILAAFDLRFRPAMKDGKPVMFWIPVQIEFHLRR